jgi:hypothetical protein
LRNFVDQGAENPALQPCGSNARRNFLGAAIFAPRLHRLAKALSPSCAPAMRIVSLLHNFDLPS